MVTLPAGVTVLPWIVKIDTVPSARLATSASVPCRLIDSPAADAPASSVVMTLGGDALRSMTDSRLSAICLVGSAGSTFWAAVTSASPSSGVSATDSGGPTTLVGAATSATTLGGLAPTSMIVTVSAGGLAMTLDTPLTNITLLSFADTASWAWAAGTTARTAGTSVSARNHVVLIGDHLRWNRAAASKAGSPWERKRAGFAVHSRRRSRSRGGDHDGRRSDEAR